MLMLAHCGDPLPRSVPVLARNIYVCFQRQAQRQAPQRSLLGTVTSKAVWACAAAQTIAMINPGFSTHNVQMSQRYVVLSSTCPTPTARAGAPLCILNATVVLWSLAASPILRSFFEERTATPNGLKYAGLHYRGHAGLLHGM